MHNKAIFIIAEAGVNHNGSLNTAKRLIDAAKESGANAVKFQTFKAKNLVSPKAQKAQYQKKNTGTDESQFEMLKKLELNKDDHVKLMRYCKKKKITFISTPFDEQSADLLEELKVPMFKIPSGEITNLSFLRHVARKRKPIILSTGMSTLEEVREAVEAIQGAGNKQITILHCVTEYPAPFKEINLRAMKTMELEFGLPIGYSDHTTGIEISIAAAALGARVIEKHFTLDRNMEGPDHKASLEPEELKQMVLSIRHVEEALGDGIKKPAACEIKNMKVARKSLVAKNDLTKGHILSEQDISIRRPGDGILPKEINSVIGLALVKNIKAGDVITWKTLQN